MILKEISLGDKPLFDSRLSVMPRSLSIYSFAQIYSWTKLYSVKWAEAKGSICVFFIDKLGCFMNCGPLGGVLSEDTVLEAFSVMDSFNKNRSYSRIENVQKNSAAFYMNSGYDVIAKDGDYLYNRESLSGLRGGRYKSKRAACNKFSKTYKSEFLAYEKSFREECLELYDAWSEERARAKRGGIYLGMLKDNKTCLETVLDDPASLGVEGRVLLVDGRVKAFTFGYELDRETFCVSFEIADLSFKGIGQYIFRLFCSAKKEYRFINAMDSSGLRGLESVKRSYRPAEVVPAYIAQRRNA